MEGLPFTADQFFAVFSSYNHAIWPWQFVLASTAAVVAIGAWRRPAQAKRTVPIFLAVLWIWSGLAYHLTHFARINPAAYVFAGLFVLQGVLWLWAAIYGRLHFGPPGGSAWTVGAVAIVYSLAIYPVLGILLGHGYPTAPTFGAPCPSTIFTFGILLWARPWVPMRLLFIPFLWAVLAAPAAIGWGVTEDAGMPLIAVVAVVVVALRNRKWRRETEPAVASTAAVGSRRDHTQPATSHP
jgi:hypothetical protein